MVKLGEWNRPIKKINTLFLRILVKFIGSWQTAEQLITFKEDIRYERIGANFFN